MVFRSKALEFTVFPGGASRVDEIYPRPQLLPPTTAWRILCRRTGGHVSRSTFYRWLESGKVVSLHMGSRMYVPWPELQEVIGRCLSGEPF